MVHLLESEIAERAVRTAEADHCIFRRVTRSVLVASVVADGSLTRWKVAKDAHKRVVRGDIFARLPIFHRLNGYCENNPVRVSASDS
jgi:hypothetical protein